MYTELQNLLAGTAPIRGAKDMWIWKSDAIEGYIVQSGYNLQPQKIQNAVINSS